jgi:hypothetical protein
MVYERFYSDEEEATAKFAVFQKTMHECKGLQERAKTPLSIGITEVADMENSERQSVCNIVRQSS